MQQLPENWTLFEGAEPLAVELTSDILKAAEIAINKNGAFHFVTAGGSTPNRCYQLLSQSNADWQHWHIYMGDERVLPEDDSERNSQALLKHWLNQVDIPQQNIYLMPTEFGAEEAAHAYAEIVDSVKEFDFCLLGMGEDGHTASLFPGHEVAESVQPILTGRSNEAPVIIETNSPKPPSERVSLSYSAFAKCSSLVKVITGKSKQDAIAKWLSETTDLPIKTVQGKQTFVYLSQDALPE